MGNAGAEGQRAAPFVTASNRDEGFAPARRDVFLEAQPPRVIVRHVLSKLRLQTDAVVAETKRMRR
jgi:hypothetical protein